MALQLTQISRSFGNTGALQDIDLNISPGEQLALIGPSGCGKTTLLRLMGTQILPSSGKLSLLNQTPTELRPGQIKHLRTRIAMIPQHLGLVANVSAGRNVLNGGLGKITLLQTIRQLICPKSAEIKRAFQILERTGIGEKFYNRTDSLSGGQQQRVAVARALYQKPAILLADEPVSAIDPARARDMIKLLTELSREEDITLIVSLHNLDLAREFFPRLVGLRDGKIVFDKSPDQLSESECQTLYQLDSR
jgi:phosphonate transport system ATP-binding protein